MARKNRKDLVGLAALAGLGMLMANRKKESGATSASPTASASPAATKDTSSDITDDMRKRAKEEGEKISEGEKVSSMYASKPTNKPADKPATAKPAATAKPSAETGYLKNPGAVSPSVGNQRGPTAEELASYNASRRKNPGTGNQRGPTAEELAAYNASRTSAVNQIPGQSAKAPTSGERVDSSELERNLGALAGVTGAAGLAYKGKKMYDASKAAKAASEAASKGREAVTNPLMWMAGPKNAKNFDEAAEVASKGREAVTNPMAWMAGPKGMAEMNKAGPSMATRAKDAIKEAADKVGDRFRKKPMSEADTTGGAIGYKRGGKVKGYASGGSVSSASNRGDGIASRGKTKCKIC